MNNSSKLFFSEDKVASSEVSSPKLISSNERRTSAVSALLTRSLSHHDSTRSLTNFSCTGSVGAKCALSERFRASNSSWRSPSSLITKVLANSPPATSAFKRVLSVLFGPSVFPPFFLLASERFLEMLMDVPLPSQNGSLLH